MQSIWLSELPTLYRSCSWLALTGSPGPDGTVCDRRRVPSEFDHLHDLKPRPAPVGGMSKYLAIFAILLFCRLSAAQFGFFEQVFQGGHPGQQQQQRPPGAGHWRAQADASEFLVARTGSSTHTLLANSSLLYVSLPRYPRMRGCTRAMPLSERGGYQVYNPRRSRQDHWDSSLCERCGVRRCR